MTATTTPRRVPKHLEILAIYDELRGVIEAGEDGRCKFVDGVDDHTIAAKLNVSPTSVANIRRVKFGKLQEHATTRDGRFDEISGQLDQLVHALSTLADAHRELQRKHDLLCTQLAVDKVANCMHLRIADPFAKGAPR